MYFYKMIKYICIFIKGHDADWEKLKSILENYSLSEGEKGKKYNYLEESLKKKK